MTTKKTKRTITHLPEEQILKFIEEDPEITIRGYLDFLFELKLIEKSTKDANSKTTTRKKSKVLRRSVK